MEHPSDGVRLFHRRHPGRQRHYNLLSKYGLTVSQYEKMVLAQGGRCACCHGVKKGIKRLSVEHNHTTGKVRGLVCQGCNVAIGMVESGRMNLAVEFLKEYDK